MKKAFIFAAAAALALAACSKNEVIGNIDSVPENIPIGFSNYAPRALTKANADNYASGATLVNEAEFDVWGWYTANGTSFTGANGTQFFSNWYTVTYKTDGGTDGTKNDYPDGPRYWPTGNTPNWLSFYAWYPSNSGHISAPASGGFGAFTFTAESSAAYQVDFMVSDVVADQTYNKANSNPGTNSGTDGTVALTFKHQLTKVQVKFKTTSAIVNDANTNIVVNSAAFGNINNTGTLTTEGLLKDTNGKYSDDTEYDSSANPTCAIRTAWSAQSGTAGYTIAVPAAALTASADYTVAPADVFLMVPQTMNAPTRDTNGDVTSDTSAQFIDVTWTITTAGIATQNTKRIYLDECYSADGGSTLANIDWDKNNSVIYVITIDPKQLLFTGTAAGWDDNTTGYYSIN